jgi:membrane-associated protease RseP (regulator of RpoE activity)
MPRSTLLAAALLVAVTAAAEAQDRVWLRQVGPGWLGISYETHWVQRGDECEPRLFIEHVVHGSPAERAGLRPGDAILALNGRPLPPSGLQSLSTRIAPGDSLTLRLRRDGRQREVVAVTGRRPDRLASVFMLRSRSGPEATRSPIVELRGDTLMARNIESAAEGEMVRGYWLAGDSGETEFKRLSRWRQDEMDRRVTQLLRCATEEKQRPVRVDLYRVQQRADSLRVRIAERALERQKVDSLWGRIPGPPEIPDDRVRLRMDDTGAWTVVGSGGGVWEIEPGERRAAGYVLRVEDHLLAGLRGVAGAELAVLEPELAEYFRNVQDGLLVLRVAPGTPADRAGLRPGDVVIRTNGRALDSVAELRALLAQPDTPLELEVVRKGRSREITLRSR